MVLASDRRGPILPYAAFVVWLMRVGRRSEAHALVRFLPDCVVLVRRLIADERVPRRSKVLLGATLAARALARPTDVAERAGRSLAYGRDSAMRQAP